jgi:hypothetical protein
MRLLLIKILLRLLSDSSSKGMRDKVVQDWLMSLSATDCGYKGYYTIRKKSILEVMSVGLEQKEYWVNIGRLAELKHLNTLSLSLIKKYAKEKNERRKNDDEEKRDEGNDA